MKKITLITLLFCSFTILFAQVPQKMSYQSVIRKTDGSLVANTLVRIKISILQGTANGTATYVETQTATTNANGLATLAIGGGTPVTGAFAGINWASGTYFIKTETDPLGGSNYTISGTSQLLSVPYALYSGSSQGKTSIVLTGNITNAQAAAQIAAEFGPYTENIYIRNTTGLTTVDLSMFTSLMSITIENNKDLTSVDVSRLNSIYDHISIRDNQVISSLSFPLLNIISSYADITRNPALTSVSLPFLKIVFEIQIDYNSSLSSIDLTSLQQLTDSLEFAGNTLSSVQINTILNKLLNVTPASGKYIQLGGQIPPAPPTGQGIIDKQTLINTGNNVSTD